jgi:Putative Actinobacterial Holin-X, holin superfamily III
MSEIINEVKEYASLTRQYLDVKVEVTKVKAKIAISNIVSSLVLGIIIVVLLGGALVILSLGLAQTIGQRLGDPAYGYYVVGVGYLLIGVLVFVLGKAFLKKFIQNEIISKLDEEL